MNFGKIAKICLPRQQKQQFSMTLTKNIEKVRYIETKIGFVQAQQYVITRVHYNGSSLQCLFVSKRSYIFCSVVGVLTD